MQFESENHESSQNSTTVETLAESSFLAAIIHSSQDTIIGLNLDGHIISWNPAAERLFGYTRTEVIGRNIRLLLPPERWYEEESIQTRVREGEVLQNFESTRVCKDGRQIDVSVTLSPVRDPHGRIVGVSRIGHDITERKRLSEKLRMVVGALEFAANAVVIADRQGVIVWINSAFTDMTGYTFRDTIGQRTNILKSGQHPRSFYEDLWKTVLEGKIWKGELTNRRKNGTLYPEEMTVTPLKNSEGIITHFIAIKQDITERLAAQSEREQLIIALQHALSDVKTLSGLLPICSSCKKIRDDKGYWNQLEVYLGEHANTRFTHGICPDCARKILSDMPGGPETI